MIARRFAGVVSVARLLTLFLALPTGVACVGTNEGATRVVNWSPREGDKRGEDDPINLPEAEQMIDELDRIMTATGTIGVKSPDVWGQDRLAKFRSEYETQMAGWLKTGFKGQVNASVRRSESAARRLQVGARLVDSSAKQASSGGELQNADVTSRAFAGLGAAEPTSPE